MSAIRVYNKTLCPELWTSDLKLDPIVRRNLLQLAKDFYEKTEFKAPVLDIYFMGSAANYNWTPDSDVDVHILIDFSQLQMPTDTAHQSVKAASSLWNEEHDIKIKGHDVEVNIQDKTDNKPHVTGIFSLVKNTWIRVPKKSNININKVAVVSIYTKLKNNVENAIRIGDRDYLKSVKEYINAYRQYGLDTKGELSTENLVFKILRSRGIIKNLNAAINKLYDLKMSVQEVVAACHAEAKLHEVTQRDIKAAHPTNPVLYNKETHQWDLENLTLDNLKALRSKMGRFWRHAIDTNADPNEITTIFNDYEKYDLEIKRRLEYINSPINEGAANVINKVKQLAEKLGVSLDVGGREGDNYTITVEAPAGFVWNSDGTHELVSSTWKQETQDKISGVVIGKSTGKLDIWNDIFARMQQGVTKCENANCDWCNGDPMDEGTYTSYPENARFGLGAIGYNNSVQFKEFSRDTFADQVHGRGDNPWGRRRFRYKNGVVEWSDYNVADAEQKHLIDTYLERRGLPVIKHISAFDGKVMEKAQTDEGYGAGIPEEDRLNIPKHRWQIKSKTAPKTPKMVNESIIDEMPQMSLKGKTALAGNSPLKTLPLEDIQRNIVMFRNDKETFFPAGYTLVYFMDSEESAQDMKDGKIPCLRIPRGTIRSGGNPITDVWKKRFQSPGTEHILGLIEGGSNEDTIFIDMISVRPGWRRNRIASMMEALIKKNYPNAKVSTSSRTDQGEKFYNRQYEGFDPQSAGPNPQATEGQPPDPNFYQDNINRMRAMEESDQPINDFKSWFGDSKVVDSSGKPLKMFHGTGNVFKSFDKSRNWFASDPSVAGEYAKDAAYHRYSTKGNANIIPVYLSIQNPKVYSPPDNIAWHEAMKDWAMTTTDSQLESQGHDGVIFKYRGITIAYPFKPNQIKSIFNRTSWDKKTDDISKENIGESHISLKEMLLLRESMHVYIDGYKPEKTVDTIDDIVPYMMHKVISPIFYAMPPDQQNYFMKNKMPEVFVLDGSHYEYPDDKRAIINFYISGYTSKTIRHILKQLLREFKSLNITVGKLKREDSRMFKSQVIRIPVVINSETQKSGPPELNLSNGNMYHIFKEILQFEPDDESGSSFSVDAQEVISRIESLRGDPNWIKTNQIEPTHTQHTPVVPGDEWKNSDDDNSGDDTTENPHDKIANSIGNALGANIIRMGLDEEGITGRLSVILEIAKWAVQHGYSKLYVA